MKILCKQTHNRIHSGNCTFVKGEWYELITRPDFYDKDTLGYYEVKHDTSLGERGLVVSKIFLQTRFLTPAEWRDKQIDSILEDD